MISHCSLQLFSRIRALLQVRACVFRCILLFTLCTLQIAAASAATESQLSPAAENGSIQSRERGFIMDLSPLIGDDGDIRAIAPDCRALAGSMRQNKKDSIFKPFAWSRQYGLSMLTTAENAPWGTASFISDDGAVTIGYLHGENIKDAGLIWRAKASPVVTGNDFNLELVRWVGLSADGRLAAGATRWHSGYTIQDTRRFVPFPGAGVFDPEKWQAEPPSPRADGSIPDDPFVGRGFEMKAMSRNGRTFAFSDDTVSFITDADRSFVRELKVGGLSPADRRTPDGRPAQDDPAARNRMDLGIPLLQKDSGTHPLPLMRNAILKEVKVTHLNYDGAYALGTVTVRYPLQAKGRAVDTMLRIFTEGGGVDEKEETFILRWDAEGGATYVAGNKTRSLAMSDDGKTILLQSNYGYPTVWQEGKGPLHLRDYLAGYGIALPGTMHQGRIWGMVMSPDGRCFSGTAPTNDPPRQAFLACAGEDAEGKPIPEPSWQIPKELR